MVLRKCDISDSKVKLVNLNVGEIKVGITSVKLDDFEFDLMIKNFI
jgi:hypothetical protein